MSKIILAVMITLIYALPAFSSEELTFQDAIVRLPAPGMKMTAMFVKITNNSDKDLKLTKATADFAQTFELHKMEMTNGSMMMRAVDSIELKKKSTTELKSGGLHIMIFDLKRDLIDGEKLKMLLTLDNKKTITVEAKAEKIK